MTQEDNIKKIIDFLSKLQSHLDDESLSKKANVDDNIEQPSESFQVEKIKKPSSWWVRVRERIYKICKEKKKVSSNASDDGGSQGGSKRKSDKDSKDQVEAVLEIQKLRSDIRQMKDAFENLNKFQTKMSKSLERDLPSHKLTAIVKDTNISRSSFHDLKEIRRKILTLKWQIPSLLYKESSSGGLSITDSQTAEGNDQINETEQDIYLPGLHVSIGRQDPTAFEEVVEKFQGLDFTEKLCLLSFAVFPENKEVKRTMLMYWWIGEGFIVCDDPENAVATILNTFSSKGLLEPVEDEKKLEPSSYKMEPHVHSAVIYLTEYMELFNLYNSKGKLTMQKSKKEKVCLVKGSSLQKEAKTSKMEPKSLKTVFNSSERYPDFTFKWFLKMESLRVLYLGRWERTAMRHIEVESTEFLKNMKDLKNLTLVSFQGISRIEELHKSICDLPKLVILDLRACYNLEALPSDIGSLDNLIYLDVSECYMLGRMPEGIADLKRLKVLKGFVISESEDEKNCAVKHLVKLRKLSITVNKFSFKVKYLMESLKYIEHLESLKIAWGARFSEIDKRGEESEEYIEAKENKETMNKEENERGLATEETHKELKEREDDNMHEKGQTSEEKKGDDEETKKQEVRQGDKENGNGDGHNEKTNLEEGKKHEEIKAEKSKSDEVTEGEKKASPSGESTKTTQNKLDDQKGKGKVEEEGDGDKEKADQDQGKKPDEAEAESSKSEKNTSVSKESTEVIQNQPEDQNKKDSVKEDGDKGKTDLKEEKKQEEVEAEKSKSDKVVEGEKKANPSQEPSDTNNKKLDDQSKVEEKGHEDKGKTDPVEEKKLDDEVESQKPKPDDGAKEVKEASPPHESKEDIQNKSTEKGKVEKEEDGDKDKVEEGKTQHEIEPHNSKSDNGVEGVKKADLSTESTNMIENKPDDHQKDEKQEEKGDSEKAKVNLEEGKKKDEVNAQSAKPDKVTPQESKDTIQSNTNDNKDNSKVQEKEDGVKDVVDSKKLDEGEVKTQKSDKSKKLGKKVSFSEEPIATIQKKPDQSAKTMAEEIHETASPSRPEKIASTKSGSSIPKFSKGKGNETKRWGRKGHEDQEIDTIKLPSSLKKLELECFPEPDPPIWLNPKNLDSLRKLSIKGGKLSKISDHELPTPENNCGVEILRLKYLHEFKAEWNELRALFPQMRLLEKYKCPKVAFCPTDGNGVWKP